MVEWAFDLVSNRPLTDADLDAFATMDIFADGDITPEWGAGQPALLHCDVEAPTLLEAVASAAARIRQVPGLRAVRAVHDDTVTLGEAAQRSGRSRDSLGKLASGKRGPGGFPAPEDSTLGTAFYSWAKIAAFLRGLGDDVDVVSRELAVADTILRAINDVDAERVPGPVLRAMGWQNAA